MPAASSYDRDEDTWFKPAPIKEEVDPEYYKWHLPDELGATGSACGLVARAINFADECYDALPDNACRYCAAMAPERLMRVDLQGHGNSTAPGGLDA